MSCKSVLLVVARAEEAEFGDLPLRNKEKKKKARSPLRLPAFFFLVRNGFTRG
jgi:hypothetical protein